MHAPINSHHTAHTLRIGSSATRRYAVMGWLMAKAFGTVAHANGPAIFKDADLKLGEQPIAQNKCTQCHVGAKWGAMAAPSTNLRSVSTKQACCAAWWSSATHAEHANVPRGSDRRLAANVTATTTNLTK